jgi:hypothetical protein
VFDELRSSGMHHCGDSCDRTRSKPNATSSTRALQPTPAAGSSQIGFASRSVDGASRKPLTANRVVDIDRHAFTSGSTHGESLLSDTTRMFDKRD